MASMVDLVFDTSAVINGQMIKLAKSGTIKDSQVIILTAVMDELVSQASSKKESGTEGLRQIGLLREGEGKLCKKIIFQGRHPTAEEIKLAGRGRMDTLIRDETLECGAELCTSDVLQHKAAQAQGVTTRLLTEKSDAEMKFLKYFDASRDDEYSPKSQGR